MLFCKRWRVCLRGCGSLCPRSRWGSGVGRRAGSGGRSGGRMSARRGIGAGRCAGWAGCIVVVNGVAAGYVDPVAGVDFASDLGISLSQDCLCQSSITRSIFFPSGDAGKRLSRLDGIGIIARRARRCRLYGRSGRAGAGCRLCRPAGL